MLGLGSIEPLVILAALGLCAAVPVLGILLKHQRSTKSCPHCEETISPEALTCKHCGRTIKASS
jgi:hypothetical protein